MKLLLLTLTTLLLVLPARAQERVDVLSESRFWIEGSSFATRFTCHVEGIDGQGRFDDRGRSLGADSGHAAVGTLTVLVANFDCGHRPMTRDLRETLKGDVHPAITFRLFSASMEGATLNASGTRVTATGSLTIAGVSRQVDMTGTLVIDTHGHYRVSGSRQLLLTDFGIDPPTKLLGLIKVRNEIDVFFDLVAVPRTGGSDS